MKILRREMKRRDPGPALAESAPAPRVRRFVASTETVDSYNSIIRADGWDLARYARNPVVLLQHASRSFPIGTGRAWVEGGALMLDVEFAPADDPVSGPEAEQAMRWVDRGVMGVSVGFQPKAEEYDASRETGDPMRDLLNPPLTYTAAELFEVSVVSVPANPDALMEGRSALAERRFRERVAAEPVAAPSAPVVAAETASQEPAPTRAACPECETEAPEGAKYCPECGASMSEAAPESEAAPAPQEPARAASVVLPIVTPAELAAMVRRITAEERKAAADRRRGKTRKNP